MLGTYRNKLGVVLKVTQFLGGTWNGVQVLGSLWVAERQDDFHGFQVLVVTEEGLRDAGYEKVAE